MRRKLFIIFALVSMICLLSFQVNASTNTVWETKSPMPTELATTQSAVVDGKIYIITASRNYEYDPISNSWITKTPMPSSRHDAPATAAYNDKIYVIGGRGGGNTSSLNEAYNPKTDTWTTKASMPTPRQGLSANVVGDKIYLISGLVASNTDNSNYIFDTITVNEVYDPATDSWTTKAPIPIGVSYYASAVVNDKIYIISGNLTQIYDAATDSWTIGSSSPYAVGYAASTTHTDPDGVQKIFVIGGKGDYKAWNNSGKNVNYTQVYTPLNDSWSLEESMPTARSWTAGASVNNVIYVIGGARDVITADGAGYNIVEAYSSTSNPATSESLLPSNSPETSPSPTMPEMTPLFAIVTIAIISISFLLLKNYRKHL